MENKYSKKEKVQRREEVDVFRMNNYYKNIRTLKKIASHLVLILFALFAVFPIYYVVITSLNSIGSLSASSLSDLLPNTKMTLVNYSQIIFQHPFFLWLRNTLILTVASTFIGVMLSITSGLAMSRLNVPAKRMLLYMLLILSLFPFTMMVIPFYFMFSNFHLLNTYLGLIIPYSAGAVIYSTYLIKNYVDGLPTSYEEAAQMDGLSKTGALFRILVPMARPVIVFAAVLAFMGPYTDYALAGQFISSPSLYTLAIGMYYVSQGSITMNYGTYAAFSVLMGIPIFILFFVFQKYLVSGFSLSMYK